MRAEILTLLGNIETAIDAIIVLVPLFAFGALSSLMLSFAYSKLLRDRMLRSLMTFLTFSSFGSTIGMFMGASSQPIVSSVLPPVITLVSGYLAFVKAERFPTKTRLLIPGALTLMLAMLQFSAWYMKFYLNPQTSNLPP